MGTQKRILRPTPPRRPQGEPDTRTPSGRRLPFRGGA
jgi:hypothetical protein